MSISCAEPKVATEFGHVGLKTAFGSSFLSRKRQRLFNTTWRSESVDGRRLSFRWGFSEFWQFEERNILVLKTQSQQVSAESLLEVNKGPEY